MTYTFRLLENYTEDRGRVTITAPHFPAALDTLDRHIEAVYPARHVIGKKERSV